MAAVSTSPPPTSDSPINSSPRQAPPGIQPVSMHGPPQLRDSPVSPVKINFAQGDWPEPSNANIEHTQHSQQPQFDLVDRTGRHDVNTTGNDAPFEDNVIRVPAFALDTRDSADLGGAAPDMSQPHAYTTDTAQRLPAKYEYKDLNPTERLRHQEGQRSSRESDETASTSQEPASIESSAPTSVSSVSGANENTEFRFEDSAESSVIDGGIPVSQSVPQFQYHHQLEEPVPAHDGQRQSSHPDLLPGGMPGRRHLTPTSNFYRRSSMPRPQSAYSSEGGSRVSSPGLHPRDHYRTPSANSHSRKSPDNRMSTYAELLNVPYPQQAPAPIGLDNSNLRGVVGNNASLLSTQKTLEMYRQNVKKTNDFNIQYSFAIFLISTAQEQGLDWNDPKGKNAPQPLRDLDSPVIEKNISSPAELVKEARHILQRLANGGYPFAQYYLADGYASGLFNKGKEDYGSAFPLFVLAAKHGHAESGYRTALCYEFGWGLSQRPRESSSISKNVSQQKAPGCHDSPWKGMLVRRPGREEVS